MLSVDVPFGYYWSVDYWCMGIVHHWSLQSIYSYVMLGDISMELSSFWISSLMVVVYHVGCLEIYRRCFSGD